MTTNYDNANLLGKGLVFVVLLEVHVGKPEALIMSPLYIQPDDEILLVTGNIDGAREFIRAYNED